MKAFNLPIDYVLYEMSYVNILTYGATLPSYSGDKDKKEGEIDITDADDPANIDKINQFGEY